ncbi:hypothetical protein AAC387_Pa07g0568 [Persea americana]
MEDICTFVSGLGEANSGDGRRSLLLRINLQQQSEDHKRFRSSSPLCFSFSDDGCRSLLLQIDLQQQPKDKKLFWSSSPFRFSFSDDSSRSLLFWFSFSAKMYLQSQ